MPTIQTASSNSPAESPRYLEIAKHFEAQRATLSKPLKLPSEQHLATEHQIARDTIRRAMMLLENQGAVTRRRGRGTYLRPLRHRPAAARGITIGFVLPWWMKAVDEWYLSLAFDGVSKWSDEHDCKLSVFYVERKKDDEHKLLEKLSARDVSGLIWIHPVPEQQKILSAVARHMPCVAVGREYEDVKVHAVLPDYRQAAALFDAHLTSRYHNRYTILGRSPTDPYGMGWINAFHEAYNKRGWIFDDQCFYVSVQTMDRAKLADFLIDYHLNFHPTKALVLTTSSYLTPLLANPRFREAVPKQISLATFDYGTLPATAYWPGHNITHVTCDWKEIGRKATETLFSLIEGNDAPHAIRQPVTLVEGNTVSSALTT